MSKKKEKHVIASPPVPNCTFGLAMTPKFGLFRQPCEKTKYDESGII
jgi:hypothetical protein